MSFLVLGTDTEVGKTVASAALALRLGRGRRVAYWKPIASGSREGRDVETVARLTAGGGHDSIAVIEETYLFEEPLSPHLAARLEGAAVDPERVTADLARHRGAVPGRTLIVEGVGGLLVPLRDDGALLADVVARWNLPSVLIARSRLGTINHTLLTLEAARARGLRVAGVVLNGPPNRENRLAIERFGGLEVLGELPQLSPLNPRTLGEAAALLDPDRRLEELCDAAS